MGPIAAGTIQTLQLYQPDWTNAAAEKNIDLVTTDLFPKSADRAEIVVHFLTQNRANSGYLLFYMKFSRNIDFYGR